MLKEKLDTATLKQLLCGWLQQPRQVAYISDSLVHAVVSPLVTQTELTVFIERLTDPKNWSRTAKRSVGRCEEFEVFYHGRIVDSWELFELIGQDPALTMTKAQLSKFVVRTFRPTKIDEELCEVHVVTTPDDTTVVAWMLDAD